jgi:hypothetical protein
VFVHDYLQLVFHSGRISIYNRSRIETGERSAHSGEAGFADGLVQLIGQSISHAELEPALMLEFEHGAKFFVLSSPTDVNGPEAFEITQENGVWTVAQNAA